jgi:hypothetical protein
MYVYDMGYLTGVCREMYILRRVRCYTGEELSHVGHVVR